MVARPSLKRVVPGSVPPWRALCAASARALKAFFSILYILQISISVLLRESKFGLMRAFVTFWDARRPTAIKKAAAVHFRSVGSLSIFAIETLLALHGAELPSALQLS